MGTDLKAWESKWMDSVDSRLAALSVGSTARQRYPNLEYFQIRHENWHEPRLERLTSGSLRLGSPKMGELVRVELESSRAEPWQHYVQQSSQSTIHKISFSN
jgi:hypothetical protein